MILLLLLLGLNVVGQNMSDEDILSLPEIEIFDKKKVFFEKREEERKDIVYYKINISKKSNKIYSLNINALNSFGVPIKNHVVNDDLVLEIYKGDNIVETTNFIFTSLETYKIENNFISLKKSSFSSNGFFNLKISFKEAGNYNLNVRKKKKIMNLNSSDLIFSKEIQIREDIPLEKVVMEEKKDDIIISFIKKDDKKEFIAIPVETNQLAVTHTEITQAGKVQREPIQSNPGQIVTLQEKKTKVKVSSLKNSISNNNLILLDKQPGNLIVRVKPHKENDLIQFFLENDSGIIWPKRKKGEYIFEISITKKTGLIIYGSAGLIDVKIYDSDNKLLQQDTLNIDNNVIIKDQYKVKKGDTLYNISKKYYKNTKYWHNIFFANNNIEVLKSRKYKYIYLIKPSTILNIPAINK